MKVLVFTDTFCDANGVSRFLQDICSESLVHNKSLTVFTSTIKKRCKSFENLQNFKPFFSFKMPFYRELDLVIPNFFKILKEAENQNATMVHVSTPGPMGLLGIYFAKKHNLPLIGTYHTNFPAYIFDNTKSKFAEKLAILFMKFLYLKFDKVLIRSSVYKEILENQLKIDPKRIAILKPGINIQSFSPKFGDTTIWHKYNIPEQSYKILYVGRLSKEKNFDFLLEFWEKFHQKFIATNLMKADFIIIGEGSLRKKADKLKDKNIHFLGFKGGVELSRIYGSSDLFVCASITETLGQVIMEGQASGLCTLVADNGGHLQIVGNGTEALPLDLEIWCDEAFKVLNCKEQMRKKSLANIEFMQSFSIEKSFEDFWLHNTIFK